MDHAQATHGSGHGWRRTVALVGAVVAVLAGGLHGTASAAVDPAQLGRSAEHAAVSCWDIKQKRPSATDGTYWLLTPALGAPQQFHCDMTTDGGGWVLIGRGREGWSFGYNGQGTAEQVRAAVDGPSAFAPRALAATVVDGLLDGGRVDQLPDGVRLRRATSTSGASRQEVRFQLLRRDRWSWAMGAEHPVGSWRFDSRTGSGGETVGFGSDSQYRAVVTGEQEDQGWLAGWAFGRFVGGSTSASSYVWSSAGRYGMPFTQVWLRPRLTAENTPFAAIPDGGTAAQAQRPLLSSEALPATWGVTGLANGRDTELDTEVQAFAQSGNRMIVGGNFRDVQRGEGGADRVEQSYLAAFDVHTGAWLSDFRPRLNGQVKDLHTLPDGSVVAAGEFTSVNGAPVAGAVALSPTTGATSSSFRIDVENRISGQSVSVTSLDAQGPWLYLGGRFTHVTGGTWTGFAYGRMAARVSLADGTPDGSWNPDLDGSVLDLDASPRGDRVYLAGYFDRAQGVLSRRVAVVTTAPGAALVPDLGRATFSDTANHQQAVREVGDRAWHGGSQHLLFSYRRSDFARLSGNITLQGGDFQAITDHAGVVYGSCHCDDFTYSEAYTFPEVGTSWTQADNINFVGAWDAATGRYLPEFLPSMRAIRGSGPWELVPDSNGTLWVGGDLDRARTAADTAWRWVGGFARFPSRDATAPSTPGGFLGLDRAGTTTLAWRPSSDDRGAVSYEILRDDRVVATTTATSATFATADGPRRYFVRAVDASGNRSASSPVDVVVPGDGANPK